MGLEVCSLISVIMGTRSMSKEYLTPEQIKNIKEFEAKMLEVEALKSWKEGVTRALWIIFGIIAAIIIRMFMMHSDIGG